MRNMASIQPSAGLELAEEALHRRRNERAGKVELAVCTTEGSAANALVWREIVEIYGSARNFAGGLDSF